MIEVSITKKYAEDWLDGKLKDHLKVTEEGTFFSGAIKFRLFNTDSFTKKIEISFWTENAKEPIFVTKEIFLLTEDSVFTFEPILLRIEANI